MHWIHRGPAPTGLEAVRQTLTPKWVAHYRNQVGERPSDDRWRDFLDELRTRFNDICGYCEEAAALGGVDHFRPKSKFPEFVYAWSNWVFACSTCNLTKNDRWPLDGYVDPCECSMQERPERFFEFTRTGMIISKPGLTPEQSARAWQTIRDLDLNSSGHVANRLRRIESVRMLLALFDGTAEPGIKHFLMSWAHRQSELSSVTRAVLAESGYSVETD